MSAILKRFWPFIKPYRSQIILGTVAVICVTIAGKVPPLLSRFLIDHILTPAVTTHPAGADLTRLMVTVGWLVLAFVVLQAVTVLFSAGRMFVMQRAGEGLIYDLRTALYRHLQRLSLSYFEKQSTGDIISRVVSDVDRLETLITNASDQLINNAVNIVVTTSILLTLSWKLTLVAFLPVPLLILMILRFTGQVRPVYRAIRDRLGDLSAKLQDNLSGIRVIKAFSREEHEAERFDGESREYYDMSVTGIRIWSRWIPALNFVQSLGNIMVLGAGAWLILTQPGSLTIGTIVAFSIYVSQFYQPIGELFHIYDSILRSTSAGERIVEILDADMDVADAPDAQDLPRIQSRVEFRGVSFKYATGDEVLRDIDLTVEPGQRVALVGRSGAGKTSLVNLVARFYDPTKGAVLVDGRDLRHVTQRSLRSQIGLVLQDTFLFNGTVKENLRYGRLAATDAEIEAAARAAYAHDFIANLPEGYDTEIGERGVKLSGGQRQRVAIARALVADPRILILDEATSMVDSESELHIQRALENLMRSRTSFIIAHRLSTVQHADLIVVLEDGKIVERDTHASLLAKGGVYAGLYDLQFRLSEEPPVLQVVSRTGTDDVTVPLSTAPG